jgi:hypothetical protein
MTQDSLMNRFHVFLHLKLEQLGLRPLETFTANFANYNYSRGYHYFFNLDTFPRV